MKQKPTGRPSSSDQIIRDIKRKTRKQYGAEEKIRIVLDGLRGEDSIAELCRREGIAQSLYYKWSKDFMEAGKKRRAIVKSGVCRGNQAATWLGCSISSPLTNVTPSTTFARYLKPRSFLQFFSAHCPSLKIM